MTPVKALLHRASYHAEKLLKRRGNFNSVLWLTEHADGRREMRETWCDNAPAEANDAEVLAHLAAEMRAEFAASGVTRFAVAYLANRVTTSRPGILAAADATGTGPGGRMAWAHAGV